MQYSYHTADIFTDTPFGGNQLAVLPNATGLNDAGMLAITREFNFSETTFVFPAENSENTRRVRIFTPGGEIPFAGHPTVGTAFVLAQTGDIELTGPETRIVLEEGVGPVTVTISSDNGRPTFAQFTATKQPERRRSPVKRSQLAEILSLRKKDILKNDVWYTEAVSVGLPFLFVPLTSVRALGQARLRQELWEELLKETWAPDIYLFVEEDTSRERDGLRAGDGHTRSRMFGPIKGVVEDPATGSAAAAFGGYLARRARVRDGTLKITIHQGVEMGRPSRLMVETDVVGGEVQETRVGGASVLISSGTLYYP
ncbi:MAG TPA: PhzF family phenazine biosynthesis protein [Gemmatimonadaceae bacterium]|jgi:trans-2,3-dihydro-3-hydroxyanthranilate isomerase